MAALVTILNYVSTILGFALMARMLMNRGGLTSDQRAGIPAVALALLCIGRLNPNVATWQTEALVAATILFLAASGWKNTTPLKVDGQPVLF